MPVGMRGMGREFRKGSNNQASNVFRATGVRVQENRISFSSTTPRTLNSLSTPNQPRRLSREPKPTKYFLCPISLCSYAWRDR